MKSAGFCVYIGPSVVGLAQSGTIMQGSKAQALAQMGRAIERCPRLKHLVIPGELLPEAREKVRTPGNALYEHYRKAVRELKITPPGRPGGAPE